MSEPSAVEERSIRVFVSSTFRDMAAERELLTKRVFPEIRHVCEERGVAFSEVDLRWGVTDEQAAEGEVLPICLAEIERCRPYFIGLLGERYGWVPSAVPESLREREPWLGEHAGRSVTELEILHGVLRDPEMAGHAFFYMRDPAYLTALDGEREHFSEVPTREEVAELGAEAAERRSAERRDRLAELKERIRRSDFAVRDGYRDPEHLEQLVREDLLELVDRLYPGGSAADPLSAETLQQRAYAEGHARVYVARPDYYEALDGFLADPGRPALTVLGESGHGKSALLASWGLRHRDAHPQDLTLMHFVGSSPLSADLETMLRRLNRELAVWAEIEEDRQADDDDALRAEFARLLYAAAARGRVVLVLDGLNQLDERGAARELTWLPAELPGGAKLIASTLPGAAEQALARRGWLEGALRVEGLSRAERLELIDHFLAHYTKRLDASRSASIADHPQSANPLYLRALLEELRVWGEHETLDRRLAELLEARNVDDLFELILARYEGDYEDAHPGLVGEAMSLIWGARSGLAEPELFELLGAAGDPLPRRVWAPLRHAASELLTERAGRLHLSHEYMRTAIGERYVPTSAQRQATHRRLADYFRTRGPVPRSLVEAPWQLAQAAAWTELMELLTDPDWFPALWTEDPGEVKALWTRVHENSELRAHDVYRAPLDQDPDQAQAVFVNLAANLLRELGALAPALELHREEERICRELGDLSHVGIALGNQGVIHSSLGELDRAMELQRESERICRELDDPKGVLITLGNQAQILRARGEQERALELHQEEAALARKIGYREGLASSLGNQGSIHHALGRPERAMELLADHERICRERGDLMGVGISLGHQAAVQRTLGELDRAMELHREEERICRELGDAAGLGRSLGNQALLQDTRGERGSAMELFKASERIYRELGDLECLQITLGNQARVQQEDGNPDLALELLREQERICRERGFLRGLGICLGQQSSIHQELGELDRALELSREEEAIYRRIGDLESLEISLGVQSLIHQERGDLESALDARREQERVCREQDSPAGVQASLGNQGILLVALDELDQGMGLLREQERICRELGDPGALREALENQALVYEIRGQADRAAELRREQERISQWDSQGG
jgi:tetratricopeptide (TPR) repeat protein